MENIYTTVAVPVTKVCQIKTNENRKPINKSKIQWQE